MSKSEELLIDLLTINEDENARAFILQSYIQTNGPVSNECGDKIKALLGGNKK